MSGTNTITGVSFQRNGVCGEGFFTIAFDYQESKHTPRQEGLIAVVPENGGSFDWTRVYVISPNDLTEHWRGDQFGAVLVPWLKENSNACWPGLYPEYENYFPHTIKEA